MSVNLTAFSEELNKIAESEESRKRPSYLRAVVAGLPVVAAQAISDVPEGIVERAVQNEILRRGKLPKAGSLLSIGPSRFVSRVGAGALTTPLFLSGMKDISESKDKKQERRGVAKLLAAGGAFSGLRGAIDAGLDAEYKHLPYSSRLKRVVGPKVLRSVATTAATGYLLGKGLKTQKEDQSVASRYVKPALIGAGIAGLSGLYESGLAEGLSTPSARWRAGAKVGGKAAAGALSGLFLSELMKRALRGKEKKASEEQPYPSPAALHDEVSRWSGGATTSDLKALFEDLMRRGGERSPSNRAALYAVHDELSRRKVPVPAMTMRNSVEGRTKGTKKVDVAALVGVATVPSLAWGALSKLPPSDRDRVLVDALDRMYVANKIHLTHTVDGAAVARGGGMAFPSLNTIAVSKNVDPAELAHEIGHIQAGSLRGATIQTSTAGTLRSIAGAASIVLPVYVVASSVDKSYATPQELESKAKAMTALGAVSAIAQSPALLEEFLASSKGLAYLSHAGASGSEVAGKALKVLGPAFATYAAPVAVPFVAAHILKKRSKQRSNDARRS